MRRTTVNREVVVSARLDRVRRVVRSVVPRPLRVWLHRIRPGGKRGPRLRSGYQQRDYEVIDYGLVPLPDTAFAVRGPLPPRLAKDGYFACVGAAQTFGAFAAHPYPELLGKCLGADVLNLGWGGAGPRFFLEHPRLITYANEARFVVLQVMSGRSEDNELFESRGGSSGVRRSDGMTVLARDVYADLLATGDAEYIRRVVAETRANWLESYRELLRRLEVPTILFWFSKRRPHYVEGYSALSTLFGEFPQLVNADMIEELRGLADDYVECVTRRGSPQLLVSRFTGRPTELVLPGRTWTHNRYYPSPEMHLDAQEALGPVCERYL